MKMSDFTYNLPEEKIAKFPPKRRGTTKLLVVDRKNGEMIDIPLMSKMELAEIIINQIGAFYFS